MIALIRKHDGTLVNAVPITPEALDRMIENGTLPARSVEVITLAEAQARLKHLVNQAHISDQIAAAAARPLERAIRHALALETQTKRKTC